MTRTKRTTNQIALVTQLFWRCSLIGFSPSPTFAFSTNFKITTRIFKATFWSGQTGLRRHGFFLIPTRYMLHSFPYFLTNITPEMTFFSKKNIWKSVFIQETNRPSATGRLTNWSIAWEILKKSQRATPRTEWHTRLILPFLEVFRWWRNNLPKPLWITSKVRSKKSGGRYSLDITATFKM